MFVPNDCKPVAHSINKFIHILNLKKMAIYAKGPLGSFSGKLGNIVGSNWRSIDYLRSLPRPSKKAATEKQLAQRSKFALAIDFLSPLRSFIDMGYNDSNQQKMTAFNQATKHLLPRIEGQYPDFTIPYDEVILSKGTLKGISTQAEINLDGDLQISWDSSINPLSSEVDDLVYIIMYNETSKDYFLYQNATRGAGEDIINTEFMGQGELHIWTAAISSDGSKRSESKYYGSVTL